MKIKRTIDGKEYEFELTQSELNEAHAEQEEKWLRYEAGWAFDNYLAEKGYDTAEKPRVNGEPGKIPGSEAYRNAWCEMFLDSHSMREDHEWERYMAEHPLAQIRRMSLEDMKPVVDETEKWLGSHPGADREYIREAVMKEFISHIWGTEPMRDVRTICVEACCKEV